MSGWWRVRVAKHPMVWRACIIGPAMRWRWWPHPSDHPTQAEAEIGACVLIEKFFDGVVWC